MQKDAVKGKKEIAPQVKAQSLAIPEEFSGWESEEVDSKNILIPKLLLMHPTSELVKQGVRNQGEIIKSTTGEVVAKRGETVDVLVFDLWKEWRIMKKNPQSQKYEFVGIAPWTPKNDNDAWDYEENGETFRRDKTINFYGLIAKEAELENAFPVKLSFTRTGFKKGMKLADAYTRALMEKQPPTRQLFKLGTVLENGADETYFAFTVDYGIASNDIQKANALNWKKIVNQAKKNNTLVDDEVDETKTTGNAQSSDF